MTWEVAEIIRGLRASEPQHSFRRISEIICESYPAYVSAIGWHPVDNAGHPNLGKELCEEAACVLNSHGWISLHHR